MTAISTMSRPAFGFGNLDDIRPGRVAGEVSVADGGGQPAAEKTASILPRAKQPVSRSTATRPRDSEVLVADRAAERHGFASRETTIRRRKRQPIEEPVDQINLRAAIADINRFIEWCEDNRYSYREGFAKLVKLLNPA